MPISPPSPPVRRRYSICMSAPCISYTITHTVRTIQVHLAASGVDILSTQYSQQ